MKLLVDGGSTKADWIAIDDLGKVLFSEFLLPFEISSILLLSAMVGAVLLAKKDKRTQNG